MEKTLPSNYTIRVPNAISDASKDTLSPIEMRLYHEIIAQNHVETNHQLVYTISYNTLFEGRNKKRKKEEIINIQKRTFFFNKEFMIKYFGQNAEASIVPIPKIVFLEDKKHIEVHIEPTFKRILTLIDKNLDLVEHKGIPYTKGAIEDLVTFKGWFTHKFYWLLREEQDKTKVVDRDYFDISIEELKHRLSCEEQYDDLFSLKRVLQKSIKELQDTFVAISEIQDLKEGLRLVKTKKRLKTEGFRFTFKYTLQDISKKAQSQEKFIWEDDLLQLKVAPSDISKLKQFVINGEEGSTKDGQKFLFTNQYVEQCISVGRKDIYERNMLKNGKPVVKNSAKWIIRGVLEGWWIEEQNQQVQEQVVQQKKAQKQKQDLAKMGTPFVVGEESAILYTYEELEQMHQHSQWAKYDIKHFLTNFIKVVPLNKFATQEKAILFQNLGMEIQFN